MKNKGLLAAGIGIGMILQQMVGPAAAELFGMSFRELARDKDFRMAVIRVIEDDPGAIASAISGNCYVDDGYVYC